MMQPLDAVINALNDAKRVAPNGEDYWMAREIQAVLGYDKWDNFCAVIQRARLACSSSDINPDYHFLDTKKVISAGKGARLERADCYLTRYACYLIAMNGDSSKPEIATAQTYFAYQTRRQELDDQLTEAQRRIALRERVRKGNKALAGAAVAAGVKRMAIFTDAGYRGLYGMGLAEIKTFKNIPESEELLDCAGRTELAANEFRITQTEQKLRRDAVSGEERAIQTHKTVGREVRAAIQRVGGTMPEHLRPERPIKHLIADEKKTKKMRLKASSAV
ncbi:MAG: DNA damage-inducible protein D [Terriglobales bacterium]